MDTNLSERLVSVVDEADNAGVCWGKVGRYPYWPAQKLSDGAIESRADLRRSKRPKNSIALMFFGDYTVSWTPKVKSWAEGISDGLYETKSPKLNCAIEEVYQYLGPDKQAPELWWGLPPAGAPSEEAPKTQAKKRGPKRKHVEGIRNRGLEMIVGPVKKSKAGTDAVIRGILDGMVASVGMLWGEPVTKKMGGRLHRPPIINGLTTDSSRDVLRQLIRRLRNLFPAYPRRPAPMVTEALVDMVQSTFGKAAFPRELLLEKGVNCNQILARMLSWAIDKPISADDMAVVFPVCFGQQGRCGMLFSESDLSRLGLHTQHWPLPLTKEGITRGQYAFLAGEAPPLLGKTHSIHPRKTMKVARKGKVASGGMVLSHLIEPSSSSENYNSLRKGPASPSLSSSLKGPVLRVVDGRIARPRSPLTQEFSGDDRAVRKNRYPEYVHIKQNVWVCRPRPKRLHIDDVSICACSPSMHEEEVEEEEEEEMQRWVCRPHSRTSRSNATKNSRNTINRSSSSCPEIVLDDDESLVHALVASAIASVLPPTKGIRRNGLVSVSSPPTVRAGCTYQCLNRASYVHCDPKTCPCGDRCSNRPFHALPLPDLEVFLTADKGWGVRAVAPIKRGTFIVEYAGEIIDECEVARRTEHYKQMGEPHFYMMEMAPGLIIDAKEKGNIARLINSSCGPNCESQKWHDAGNGEIRVGIFALRDIAPGEELTYDYKFQHFGLAAAAGAYLCNCGAPNCRGTMDTKPERTKDLGRRIEVFWPLDDVYYMGIVTGYSAKGRKHTIKYDEDGAIDQLCLERETYRWLDNNGACAADSLRLTTLALPPCVPQPAAVEKKKKTKTKKKKKKKKRGRPRKWDVPTAPHPSGGLSGSRPASVEPPRLSLDDCMPSQYVPLVSVLTDTDGTTLTVRDVREALGSKLGSMREVVGEYMASELEQGFSLEGTSELGRLLAPLHSMDRDAQLHYLKLQDDSLSSLECALHQATDSLCGVVAAQPSVPEPGVDVPDWGADPQVVNHGAEHTAGALHGNGFPIGEADPQVVNHGAEHTAGALHGNTSMSPAAGEGMVHQRSARRRAPKNFGDDFVEQHYNEEEYVADSPPRASSAARGIRIAAASPATEAAATMALLAQGGGHAVDLMFVEGGDNEPIIQTRASARRNPAVGEAGPSPRPGSAVAAPARARALPTPGSTGLPARTILVAKRLTNSDCSKGRILLPRAAVEANLSFAIGRAHVLAARDHLGEDWRFTLQSWANGMESRRVYVLEHAAEFIRRHALRPDDVIGISCTPDNTEFLVEFNTDEVCTAAETQQAARVGSGGGPSFQSPMPQGSPNLLVQRNSGRCTRSEFCSKPAGHPGFCTRTAAGAAAAARKGGTRMSSATRVAVAHPERVQTSAFAEAALKRAASAAALGATRQKRTRRTDRRAALAGDSDDADAEEEELSFDVGDDEEEEEEEDDEHDATDLSDDDVEGVVHHHRRPRGKDDLSNGAYRRDGTPPPMPDPVGPAPGAPPIFVMAPDLTTSPIPPGALAHMHSPLRPRLVSQGSMPALAQNGSMGHLPPLSPYPPPGLKPQLGMGMHRAGSAPAGIGGNSDIHEDDGAAAPPPPPPPDPSEEGAHTVTHGGGGRRRGGKGPSLPKPVAAPTLPSPPGVNVNVDVVAPSSLLPIGDGKPLPPTMPSLFGAAPPTSGPGVAPINHHSEHDFDVMGFLT